MNTNRANAGFDDRHPDVFQKVEGGGCLSVFGLPFLLVGLFLIQVPLGLIPVDVEDFDQASGLLIALFGLPFFLAGAALVFGRSRLTIDRSCGSIVQWWGLLVPVKARETQISLVQMVSLGFDPGDSDSPATYPVKLVLGDSRSPIPIRSGSTYPEMRALAERLAAFLGKPLEDTSTGMRVVRDPKRLDESLRERVRRLGEKVDRVPSPPVNLRTRVEKKIDTVVLEIPALPRTPFHFIPVIFAAICAAVVGVTFLPDLLGQDEPLAVRIAVASFVLLVFILGPILLSLWFALGVSRKRTVITAGRDHLQIEEWSGKKCKRSEIPTDELEDLLAPQDGAAVLAVRLRAGQPWHPPVGPDATMLDGKPLPAWVQKLARLAGTPGITAVSDQGTVTFGAGLPPEEIAYLYALIRRALVS